jgi:hypothetical protein
MYKIHSNLREISDLLHLQLLSIILSSDNYYEVYATYK